ncbi:MAG: flagellar basal body-associated FliL family protein [Blautia sp.]|nr:flagellar basal body-associated FliL family protein [Blautia sp.]
MKKNLISVLILALVFANFVLTAILMFSVLPQTKKANALIDKVCQAIDLDLNSGDSSSLDNIPVEDREEYAVNSGADITATLASVEGDKGSHYAVVNVTLVLNKGSENYKTYNQEFMAGQDSTIRATITDALNRYTVDDLRNRETKQTMQDEVLEQMQMLFGGDYVIAVNFSKFTME